MAVSSGGLFCFYGFGVALKGKQKRFCEEYQIDMNATQAAIRAGYSAKTAHSQGPRLLENVEVKVCLDQLNRERLERTKIDVDYVLMRMVAIDQMDIIDILQDDGTLRPIKEWLKIWRQYLSAMEIAEITEGQGDQKVTIGVLKKIKWPDKVKNLELLGRHVNVQAFKDQVEEKGKWLVVLSEEDMLL